MAIGQGRQSTLVLVLFLAARNMQLTLSRHHRHHRPLLALALASRLSQPVTSQQHCYESMYSDRLQRAHNEPAGKHQLVILSQSNLLLPNLTCLASFALRLVLRCVARVARLLCTVHRSGSSGYHAALTCTGR